jgi:hypothetical protein
MEKCKVLEWDKECEDIEDKELTETLFLNYMKTQVKKFKLL